MSDFHFSVLLRVLVVSEGSGLYRKVRETAAKNADLVSSKSDHRIPHIRSCYNCLEMLKIMNLLNFIHFVLVGFVLKSQYELSIFHDFD